MRFLHTAVLAVAALASASQAYAQRPAEDYFVLNPAPGVIESFNSYFTLVGEDGATIANGEKATATITLSCPDGGVINMQTARLGTVIRIAFPASVDIPTAAGDYTLYIPDGRFAVDGMQNNAAAYGYTIEAQEPEDPNPPVTPGDVDPERDIHVTPAPGKVASLSQWSITFDCEWGLGDRSAKFTLTGPDGVEIPALRSGSTGTAYTVSLADDAVLKAPGTYVFTIPAGKFVLGKTGIPNPALSYTYTIDDGNTLPQSTITPAPGSYQSLTGTFTITFADGNVTVDASAVTLQGPEELLDITVSAEGSTVTVQTPNALTQEGPYVLYFAPGAITVDGVGGAAMRYVYQITSATGEIWSGSYTAVPADGSVLESLSEVDITFDGVRKVKVSDYAGPNDFPTLYDAIGGVLAHTIAYAEDNVLMLSIPGEVKLPGEYKLVVPKAFILLDGATPAENIVLTYTIPDTGGHAAAVTCTLNPASGAEINFSQEITLEFAGEGLVSVTNNPYAWGREAPYFSSADGYFCPSVQVAPAGDTRFVLSHYYAFEDEGEYSLTIPAGYFTLVLADGTTQPAAAAYATYRVKNGSTALSSLAADGTDAEVYTISGVATGVRASEAATLPAGIYVVAGKCLIVR